MRFFSEMKYVLSLCLTFAVLLYNNTTFSQFEGESGSGHAVDWFSNSACNSFLGDESSGYHSMEPPVYSNCHLFYGDSSSGFSTNQVASGGNCTNFFGSDFSGHESAHFVNTESTCFLFTESVNGASGHSSRSYSADNDDACAFIVLGIESSPLFGELLDENTARLYWETYSERSNAGFELHRSTDGEHWEQIAWIDGAGESTTSISYEYVDVEFTGSGNYYRFRQVDFDGMSSYSNTVYLSAKSPSSLKEIFALYPNPTNQYSNVKLKAWVNKEWQVQFSVMDISGRVIYSDEYLFNQGQDVVEIPTDSFAPGTYYLVVQTDRTKELLQLPFIVNH